MLDDAPACFCLDPCAFGYPGNQFREITGFFTYGLLDELKPREFKQSVAQLLHAVDILFDSGQVTANLLRTLPSTLEQNLDA
jgi:hypothetical protein